MHEWQIDPQEYLKRLDYNFEEFKNHFHLPEVENIKKIIPLRDIKTVLSLVPISFEFLTYLVRRIPTLDGKMPFLNATIKLVKIDPRHLKIGQKFVYRENYQQLLEDMSDIFSGFVVTPGGVCDLGGYFVFGLNGNDDYSLACYLPPILEKHGSDIVIMDGIHRDYIVKQFAPSLNTILVENISLPFPCGLHNWSEIEVIQLAQKPEAINDRYFELKKDLFRDLKYLGIDG